MLLLGALDGIGVAINRAAAQTFERAPPAHHIHVPTVRSTRIDCAAWTAIYVTVSSMYMALQGLSLMHIGHMRMHSAWEAHKSCMERAISVVRSRSPPLLVALSYSESNEERNFEYTGGLWRPRLGYFALLASV